MTQRTTHPTTLLPYCVGIDVTKDALQICLSVIDTTGKVTIKGSSKVSNKATAFAGLLTWVNKHCQDKTVPVRYLMESTGVYHEQLAWYLFQQDLAVSIILPNKAKHYLKSIGNKSKNDKIDARGLAQMGLEQCLPLWQPLSKNIYTLRMLTRQHQRLQELKNQSVNQKHSIMHSQTLDEFIIKQLDKLIKLYDQQIDQIGKQITKLLEKDGVLKARIA